MSADKLVIGWREWIGLPDLGVRRIKVKVDTGARTSALHAEEIRYYHRRERAMVGFTVYPKQRSREGAARAVAELIDRRRVRSSNGKQEERPLIRTSVRVGERSWEIELTLTSRDDMGFPMLLGRQAVRRYALVDPGRSFVTRRKKKKRPSS